MDCYALVRPEHLNQYGSLFGGMMLKWVDEFAWLAATRAYPQCRLVTIGMNNIQFRHRVDNGSILRFRILPLRTGHTSVCFTVKVYAAFPGIEKEKLVFRTQVTFVNVDETGRKRPVSGKDSGALKT